MSLESKNFDTSYMVVWRTVRSDPYTKIGRDIRSDTRREFDKVVESRRGFHWSFLRPVNFMAQQLREYIHVDTPLD